MYQLPNFTYYSYWYMMILLDEYSMLLWLVHGYHTRNVWLSVMGLVHRIEFVVQTVNIRWYTYFIIRLVHMNIVIVSTCEYTFVVTHWIPRMLVACYMLVHWNNMVFNTYEIQQIHVTFYLISTYKWPGCY